MFSDMTWFGVFCLICSMLIVVESVAFYIAILIADEDAGCLLLILNLIGLVFLYLNWQAFVSLF